MLSQVNLITVLDRRCFRHHTVNRKGGNKKVEKKNSAKLSPLVVYFQKPTVNGGKHF